MRENYNLTDNFIKFTSLREIMRKKNDKYRTTDIYNFTKSEMIEIHTVAY